MTHSHKNTLLARMGFNDIDANDPIHDVACRYLTLPDVARRIVDDFFPHEDVDGDPDFDRKVREEFEAFMSAREDYRGREDTGSLRAINSTSIETPISKGEGKYKTTVGFLDGLIKSSITRKIAEVDKPWNAKNSLYIGNRWLDAHKIFIEVKIAKVSFSEVAKQIRLYREYISEDEGPRGEKRDQWVVFVAFDPSQVFVSALENEDIAVRKLGGGFREFVEQVSKAEPAELKSY